MPVRRALVAVRVTAAIFGAAAIAALARTRMAQELDVATDIVGYPSHSDFNIYGYFATFTCAALLFPALAYAFDVGLARVFWGGPVFRRPLLADRGDAGGALRHGPLASLVGVVVGGAGIGAFAGMGAAWLLARPQFWTLTAAGALAGALAVGSLRPWMPAGAARSHRVVALASPLGVLAVAAAEASSHVLVGPSQAVRVVHWLPVWVPLLIAAAGVTFVAQGLRVVDEGDVSAFRARVTGGFLGATAVFLYVARLQGEIGLMDFFHEGEGLAAVDLFRRGLLPWRDVLFIHGIMADVVRPAVGMLGIEDSRWGSVVGQTLLFGPLYWLGYFFLNRYLLNRHTALLIVSMLAIANGNLAPADLRFLLQPLVLLALGALLQRATRRRAVVFSVVATVHGILTPEGLFLLVACAIVIVAFEVLHRPAGARWWQAVTRTRWCAAAAAAAIGTWLVVLVVSGTLSGYLFYFRTFARDHELAGGIPVNDVTPLYWFAAIAPGVLALVTLAWFGVAFRLGRRLPVRDWVALAIALFTLLYYRKYLSRADGHVYQVLAQALPLLWYIPARAWELTGVRRGEGWTANVLQLRPLVAAIACLFVLPEVAEPASLQMRQLPGAFAAAAAEVVEPRLGYARDSMPPTLLPDVRRVVDALTEPDDRVFDMSNNPALFYYFLEARPVSRYYHVSMAIRRDTQEDALYVLRTERPVLVVMDGATGLPAWDGIPNSVRHYLLSRYVLDNYRPVIGNHGFVFLVRNDRPPVDTAALSAQLSHSDDKTLLAGAQPCAWKHAPAFFDGLDGPRTGERVQLSLGRRTETTVAGWARDPRTGGAPSSVIGVVDGELVARASVGLPRPDVAAALGLPALAGSGFQMTVPVVAGSGPLVVFVVSPDGIASIVGPPGNTDAATASAPPKVDGRPLTVVPGIDGAVDRRTPSEMVTVATLPAGADGSNFSKLEVQADGRFGDDTFEVRATGSPGTAISFATDEDVGQRYEVPVDNCPQWTLVERSITISNRSGRPIAAAALVR